MKDFLQMLTQATISCHQMAELLFRQVRHTRAQSQHKSDQIILVRMEQPVELIRYLVRKGFVLLIVQIAKQFD